MSEPIGPDTNTAYAEYIQLYQGSVKTLTELLESIRQASCLILPELVPEELHAAASALRAPDSRSGRSGAGTAGRPGPVEAPTIDSEGLPLHEGPLLWRTLRQTRDLRFGPCARGLTGRSFTVIVPFNEC